MADRSVNASSDANFTCDSSSTSGSCAAVEADGDSPHKTVEMVFIALVTGSLSFVTVVGNILVMLSIKVNRHLQTVNNYFLFSLACADLIIGVFSMNLYTVYIIKVHCRIPFQPRGHVWHGHCCLLPASGHHDGALCAHLSGQPQPCVQAEP
uniref:G-protein coupled receptors family 1 profile domain-containing protein n=1 Tax=Sinocyclocheilus anshuiensis TaxID=1608454 RepID=A0A671KFB5_9TELE